MARLKGGHVDRHRARGELSGVVRKLELDVLDEDAATEFLLERTRGRSRAGG